MFTRPSRAVVYFLIAALLVSLPGCNFPGLAAPATATLAPTNTPRPTETPLPTETPAPSPTFTLAPTATQPPPAPPTEPPPPTVAATLSVDQAILVYYINKDEAGPYGCGEALWYLKTQQPKTSSIADNVRFALSTILSYHSDTIGTLYNPGYASNLAVSDVTIGDNNSIQVALTGTYERTKDNCDGKRLIDQLRMTIKQFSNFGLIQITINGTPIADAVGRK